MADHRCDADAEVLRGHWLRRLAMLGLGILNDASFVHFVMNGYKDILSLALEADYLEFDAVRTA